MGKMSLLQYRFRVIPVMRIRHDHQFSFTTRSLSTYAPLPISFPGFIQSLPLSTFAFGPDKGKTGGQTGKPWQRLVKLNTQSVRVHGTNAKLIRRDFTVDNGLRISDASQRGKPAKGKAFWDQRGVASYRQNLGGHRRSIGPLRIIPQRKRPDTIIIALPLAGDAGIISPFFVLVNQPFKQIADHLNFRQPNGFRWI